MKNCKFTTHIFKGVQLIKVKVKTYWIFLLSKVKRFIKIEFLNFFLTTVIAISTAIASYLQWDAMQQQLNEMKLARISEQAPAITHNLQDEVVEPNKKISFKVVTKNYGKSGLGLHKYQKVLYGIDAQKNMEKWFELHKGTFNLRGKFIIPPREGMGFTYTTVESETELNLKEYEDFIKGTYQIIVVVKEDYSDMSGYGYSSETAIQYQPNKDHVILINTIDKADINNIVGNP